MHSNPFFSDHSSADAAAFLSNGNVAKKCGNQTLTSLKPSPLGLFVMLVIGGVEGGGLSHLFLPAPSLRQLKPLMGGGVKGLNSNSVKIF